MKLEEKIALQRKKQGWSQEEFAFRLEVSRQAVSKWEMGTSLPDLDRIIKMSELFGCSTDYLLKDEDDHQVARSVEKTEEGVCAKRITDEEGETYLALVKKIAWKLALGIALCILSPVCLIVLLGLAASGRALSDGVATGVGVTLLLCFCAVGVALIILCGIALAKFEYLDEEEIKISERLKERCTRYKEKQTAGYAAAICVGVALCILSAIPLILCATLNKPAHWLLYCVGILLVLVACAVFLFVCFGEVRESYSKLLQEGEFSVKEKWENQATSTFSSVYWGIIVAGYLLTSFLTNEWGRTWIVWPIAGVLFACLTPLVVYLEKRKRNNKNGR